MKIERVWAMPSKNTFDILPIGKFVRYYLSKSKISIDPFARDKKWAIHTNDLNPDTKAEYHMLALDFLQDMFDRKIKADLVFFDPPYSARQVRECYDNVGLKMTGREGAWRKEKNLIDKILISGGTVLSFGWNSIGQGIKRYYEILEILLVCHGGAHNDTICLAEQKMLGLFNPKGIINGNNNRSTY